MNEMKTIYHVEGKLCKEFVGQISYTVCLEQSWDELDIEFSFSPQYFRPEDLTQERIQEITEYCKKEYPDFFSSKESLNLFSSDDEIKDAICHNTKTEIHTLATLNDEFIGGIHRQLSTRHMHFTKADASDGCIPQSKIEGVLKVTLIVFSVLLDNTEYSLTVRVR